MGLTDRFDIPRHLSRRITRDADVREGEVVVVWLRVAVRGHENPALDLGRVVAHQLGVPLLVYHAVSERYPHANDRHHLFILEGARDLAHELKVLGISLACHVERPGHRGPVLRDLAESAAVVVADAMPLDPLRAWTRSLARRGPVVEVDASCNAPMHTLSQSPDRAFAFRKASAAHRDPVAWPWPEELSPVRRYEGPLPFEPVDLTSADLGALVGSCDIDHTVPPVRDTRGGSVAGYARWQAFRDGPLKRYAWLRNDAAKHWGVSRMSAYLHYGHVSPFRIAREASERNAKKFLDELLTWREMSWHVCFHEEAPKSVDRLPAWAVDTLREHASDPRTVLPLEELEQGRTGSRLWDAAQRSLLLHGELHNNVRMTWGKAVLGWSRGPRQALARLYALNDRFALDGRDPSSVGGIHWCLGCHDRPFPPARPIFGLVRGRGVEHHADRLDLAAYEARVARPAVSPARVLVIGTGMAGATVAHHLALHGVEVTVVDKARGPGGRMASRRRPEGRYDHGAQSFTARDSRFARQVRVWEAAGVVARWQGRLGTYLQGQFHSDTPRSERWVGTPKMSAITGHLLRDVDCRYGVRVVGAQRVTAGISVNSDQGPLGVFDRVVLTAPAPQARELSGRVSPKVADLLDAVEVTPCWAGLVEGGLGLELDAVRVSGSPIRWLARQDGLHGRSGSERWVLHATGDWSTQNLEASGDSVAQWLQAELATLVGRPVPTLATHRWRYARVTRPVGTPVLVDRGWMVAGDACLGPRVESAWLSATAAVGVVLRELSLAEPVPMSTLVAG